MKFFYIFYYVVCYVNVAQLGDLATFCANGVGFCRSVAFFIFRDCPELVVCHKVRFNKHCYCVVYGGTAHTELALLEVFHQLFYFKTAVD